MIIHCAIQRNIAASRSKLVKPQESIVGHGVKRSYQKGYPGDLW